MTKKKSNVERADSLRLRAEEIVRQKVVPGRDKPADSFSEASSLEEFRAILHDLRVHQIELDMQNQELREKEEVLAAARLKYYDLYDLAPVGYFTLSSDRVILEANRTLSDMLGLHQGALSSRPLSRYILREDQDIYYHFFNRIVRTGGSQPCELRLVKEGGTELWAQLDATASKGANGEAVYHVVVTDITARKTMEEKLANIVRSTNVGTWEWNVKTGETVFNERWAEIVGYTLAELEPVSIETWLRLAHPDDLKESGRLLQAHFAGKKDYYSCESRMLHKNGFWVWVYDSGQVIERDEKGTPVKMFGTHTDITERKLSQTRMNQMERLSSLGGLAAGVVHEISQPLQALKVTADGMVYWHDQGKAADPDKIIENCRRISVQAERIAAILKRLRSFIRQSKAENVEAVKLNDAEKQAVELFEASLKAHNITLRERLSAEQPVVLGNSGRLEEVIINLVVNAMQAMETMTMADKEIVITTSCQAEKVVLAVYNNGPAIPDEVMDKIFDPLYSTKENSENMGLGLSIVQSIVAAHEGKISVTNHDAGVSFRIEFPRYRPHIESDTKPPNQG